MPIEYEHRYLLSELPLQCEARADKIEHYRQSYIVNDDERKLCERIRAISLIKSRYGSQSEIRSYKRTIKCGDLPKVNEVNSDMTEDEYNELEKYFTIGIPIDKIRHTMMINDLCWEIDVFTISGKSGYYIIAELENPPDIYDVPFYNAINITGDHAYSNVTMAMGKLPPTWKQGFTNLEITGDLIVT